MSFQYILAGAWGAGGVPVALWLAVSIICEGCAVYISVLTLVIAPIAVAWAELLCSVVWALTEFEGKGYTDKAHDSHEDKGFLFH